MPQTRQLGVSCAIALQLCACASSAGRVTVDNRLGGVFSDAERDHLVRLAQQHLGVQVEKVVLRTIGHPHSIATVQVFSAWRERDHGIVERDVLVAYHARWTGPPGCKGRSSGGWCLGSPRDQWVERHYRLRAPGGRRLSIRVEDGHLPGAAEVQEVQSLVWAVIRKKVVAKREIPSPLNHTLPLYSIAPSSSRVCSARRDRPGQPLGYVLMYGHPLMGTGFVFVKRGGRWHHERTCGWVA